MTPQHRAERASSAMWETDAASKSIEMRIDSIEPGGCTASMEVKDHHLNGHKICHGGFIFMLADSAFAYACNSYNQVAVAQHNTITFVAPGKPGERLIARAVEVSKTGRNGIYDVSVSGKDGRLVAEFRGCSRTVKGHHFDEDEE